MRNFRVIDIYVKNCCLRLVTNRTGSMVFHSDLDPDGAENHNNFSSWIHLSFRLRAVSLLLENPLGKSSRARVTRERKAVARLPPRALLAASPARTWLMLGHFSRRIFEQKRETAHSLSLTLRQMAVKWYCTLRYIRCEIWLSDQMMEGTKDLLAWQKIHGLQS